MFSKGSFAWLIDTEEEANLIKTMKKASRLSILAKQIMADKLKIFTQ